MSEAREVNRLEQDNLSSEFNELIEKIQKLQEILDDKNVLQGVVRDELNEIKESFGDERKTDINDARQDISNEDLIPEETRVLTLQEVAMLKPSLLLSTGNREGEVWARLRLQ